MNYDIKNKRIDTPTGKILLYEKLLETITVGRCDNKYTRLLNTV